MSNLNSLTGLVQLASLSLYKTRVADLSPLAGLTNLQFLHLSQNRLTNISSLASLPRLVEVDLTLNLLDLRDAATTDVIHTLRRRGVKVADSEQRQPPAFEMNTNWVICAGRDSWLYFQVTDNAPWSDITVNGISSDGNVIGNTNLVVGQVMDPYSLIRIDWFLKVSPSEQRYSEYHLDGHQ